ncbi:MAG: carbonic anhydrase, partial [Planctomycetes bacterium]|nr:carbonic anhydrase [Planctomycetota bacterium]
METDFNPGADSPKIGAGSYVWDDDAIIGSVEIGANVFVAPHAFLR